LCAFLCMGDQVHVAVGVKVHADDHDQVNAGY
jgi:hypothetical protein